jgi:hypothetical protein
LEIKLQDFRGWQPSCTIPLKQTCSNTSPRKQMSASDCAATVRKRTETT